MQTLYFTIRDLGAVTAYNDTDAQHLWSGPDFIRMKYKRTGESGYQDYIGAQRALVKHKQTHQMAGHNLPNDILLGDATDLNSFYLPFMTMYDFRNIDIEDASKQIVMGGIPTTQHYEFVISPAQVMSSNCELIIIAQNWSSFI